MYYNYCVAPNKGGCSPPDGAYLIATKKEGTSCNAIDQIFILDEDGVIHHKCSKKVICPEGEYLLSIFSHCFSLLLLIKVLHISIARQCRWPYDLIKVTLSDAINFVSINPPPVLSDLVILYHNCHRQESIYAISVFYKFKLLINCLSWDKIWKDGATQITNHFAWPHRPIRK